MAAINNKPKIYRPVPTAQWIADKKWGPNLGDRTEYTINRPLGGSLEINAGNKSVSIPKELIEWFADVIAQASVWEDNEDNQPKEKK